MISKTCFIQQRFTDSLKPIKKNRFMCFCAENIKCTNDDVMFLIQVINKYGRVIIKNGDETQCICIDYIRLD